MFFPLIRIVQESEGQHESALMHILTLAIKRGELYSLPFRLFSPAHRELAMSFIKDLDFSAEMEEELVAFLDTANISLSTLLLLRGIFANKILVFALKEKRWRVDYGLDLQVPPRTMLAVPYRAKDKPDPRADFGHPEIALIFTCLSYYYGGLTEDQLRVCFDLIAKCQDPPSEYQVWIRDLFNQLPESLRRFSGVNILDQRQWKEEIYPRLQRCKAVIDFYLSHHVFPREAKEFPHKLTTNSWDLAKRRVHLTTGFSGTNDNRHLLPLSIRQKDSPNQHHTNALVVLNLLDDQNDHVICESESNARIILATVTSQRPPVHVLLDVGAQVLEMTNREVALAWLEKEPSSAIRAAVYFDDKDEAIVLMRNGSSEHLKRSPMLKQLESCLVYLDEAHTRGTDFPFPVGTRAMVTLGPRTGERQACPG